MKQDQHKLIMRSLVKNKEVLDVGCVNHDLDRRNKGRFWQHDYLRKYSKYILGIDYLKEKIEDLKKEGYNVLHANAEDFEIDRRFDVIYAGEIIEHLSNPGKFLSQASKHLKGDGILVITVPNTYCLRFLLRSILKFTNDIPVNPEHTNNFTPQTLKELLRREGFLNTEFLYFHTLVGKNWKKFIRESVTPYKFRERMFVIAKKGNSPTFTQSKSKTYKEESSKLS